MQARFTGAKTAILPVGNKLPLLSKGIFHDQGRLVITTQEKPTVVFLPKLSKG